MISKELPFWVGRTGFFLLMVPGLILSILYWKVQADEPLNISGLLVQWALQIITAMVFPIALLIVLLAPVTVARRGAVVASICSSLLGVSASVSALRSPIMRVPTVLAIICSLIGVVSFVWLTHKVILAARWRFSLIGLLALLPLIQFWHTTSYAPTRVTPAMSVTEAVIKKRSETESANRISLTFQLKNVSDVGVFVLSSQVLYCFRAPDDDMNYSMDQLYSDTDHCSHGQILGDRSVTEANTSTVYHTALSVPKDRSLFQLFVRAYYGRNDRLRADFDTTNVDDAQKADCKPGPHIGTYRLSNESRIKGLVQRPRYVTYQGEKDGATYYAITAKGEPLCVSNNDLWRYYGIQWVYSYQQEWVPAK